MDAAVRAGINTRRHLVLVYVLSALLAGIAGIIWVFQTGQGNFIPIGSHLELFAIAAVIIGGASLNGGKGRIIASLIGVFILEVLDNGLTLSGVETFVPLHRDRAHPHRGDRRGPALPRPFLD